MKQKSRLLSSAAPSPSSHARSRLGGRAHQLESACHFCLSAQWDCRAGTVSSYFRKAQCGVGPTRGLLKWSSDHSRDLSLNPVWAFCVSRLIHQQFHPQMASKTPIPEMAECNFQHTTGITLISPNIWSSDVVQGAKFQGVFSCKTLTVIHSFWVLSAPQGQMADLDKARKLSRI